MADPESQEGASRINAPSSKKKHKKQLYLGISFSNYIKSNIMKNSERSQRENTLHLQRSKDKNYVQLLRNQSSKRVK